MQKKAIAILLLLTISLSFSACTNGTATKEIETPSQVETEMISDGAEEKEEAIPEKSAIETPTPTEEIEEVPEPIFTNDDDVLASAEIIKGLLEEHTDNTNLLCAMMGMILRESKFYSYRVAHQRSNSQAWTQKIDEGLMDGSTKEYFIDYTMNVSGGYGLAMWLSYDYLDRLYDFAQEWGTSIGDARMQCAFLVYDIENYFPEMYEDICNSSSVVYAGEIIGRLYERTADYPGVGGNAKYFYDMYYNGQE